MRKSILYIINLFIFLPAVFAQSQSGVINYTVTYNWLKMSASVAYMPKDNTDRMSYVWGNNSESNTYAVLTYNDSTYSFAFKEDDANDDWGSGKKELYNINRNYIDNKSYDFRELVGKKYLVIDSVPPQKWRIKNNMKEIAGHMCMNAEFYDTTKEQVIEAWFALDMPLSIGPAEYFGLPGTILEINKANGSVVYTATSIIPSKDKINIEKGKKAKKIKIITYTEYNKIIWEKYQESKKMKRPYFWNIGF